jgi:hypothetical protein
MTWLWELNLIHLFSFYLAAIFLLGLWVRFRQYQTILGLVRTMPGRWPRLLDLIRGHLDIFVSWQTAWPGLLALGLCLAHTAACHWIWPWARLTIGGLLDLWPAVPIVLVCGLAMLGLDVYGLFQVGTVDRPALERHFDQAEYWLKSWAGSVLRVVTFGYVNPRLMVEQEVRKALIELNKMFHFTLWWIIAQTALRIAYGLSLWLTFAWAHQWLGLAFVTIFGQR